MELIRGKQPKAIKCLLYGPEGIGKSTFAAQFPNPVFIDTEGSTDHMDVARTPKPSSWTMLLEQVKHFIQHPDELGTLVVDTLDWAERMCIEHVCALKQVDGIEGFGYGKGYVYLAEEFGKLLDLLEALRDKGVHIMLTAHAAMRKFEQPDELGAYDRWELKLQKKTAPLCKEWADMLLLANYKTYVVNVDNQGSKKGRNKAQGGARVMYTTHHPCWDAKNRHDLPGELPLDFSAIAHCLQAVKTSTPPPQSASDVSPATTSVSNPEPAQPAETTAPAPVFGEGLPKALVDLMVDGHVTEQEVQDAVASKGYYPAGTPIQNYDPGFISGVLVGAWPQVLEMVMAARPAGSGQEVPF